MGERYCTPGAAVEFSNNVNSLQRIRMTEGLYTFWSSWGIFQQCELFNSFARLLCGKWLFTQQKVFSLVLTPKCGSKDSNKAKDYDPWAAVGFPALVNFHVLFKMSDSAKYSLLSQVIWSILPWEKKIRVNKRLVWIFFLGCICMCFHWMLKATKKKFFSKNSCKKTLLSMRFKI